MWAVNSISIHAPRTGSDFFPPGVARLDLDFNPRSPHGERPGRLVSRVRWDAFQSTLPARGATRLSRASLFFFVDFNPRSPHGERRTPCTTTFSPRADFNPRSPHGERHFCSSVPPGLTHFNPRSPHGERHPPDESWERTQPFQSTLPARGATRVRAPRPCRPRNFNPRSPHGERLKRRKGGTVSSSQFQSTLPARGATAALP